MHEKTLCFDLFSFFLSSYSSCLIFIEDLLFSAVFLVFFISTYAEAGLPITLADNILSFFFMVPLLSADLTSFFGILAVSRLSQEQADYTFPESFPRLDI